MRSQLRKLTLGLCALLALAQQQTASATALDRYVAKPDAAYGYTSIGMQEDVFANTYFLNMTSQQWRSAAEVDRPVWQHDVSITVPRGLRLDKNTTALLVVTGGNNGSNPTRQLEDNIDKLALLTRTVVIVVHQVPNQPLQFFEESPSTVRKEDAILAYSAHRFLSSCNAEGKGCDGSWPVHVAMVKAVVRTMDTAIAFLKERGITIKDFVVTGASKRGWTTWLTAAVDRRVRGIIPISFDALNLERQTDRIWAAYDGQYPAALNDYAALNVFCAARGKANGRKLYQIIDPFSYRDRLRMPKLIINSAGDQFFLPDASQQYYAQLPGDNRLRYTFNTDHSQQPLTKELLLSAVAWFNDVKASRSPPSYAWEIRGGKLIVTTSGRVKNVSIWRTTDTQAPQTRDFRLETLGTTWIQEALSPVAANRYEAPLSPAAPGTWTAQSVQIEFEKPSRLFDALEAVIPEANLFKRRQVFTTDVTIRPKRLPRDPLTHCSEQ